MLKEIILTKPWGGHASGEVVNVDPLRAEKLIEDGYGVEAGGYIPAKPGGHRVTVAGKGRAKA